MSDDLVVEGEGETVGEAKWNAVRELERLAPGLDRAAVSFEVLSEGERGLLGVGYTPARVVACAPRAAVAEPAAREAVDESDAAATVRELLARVTGALEVPCRISVEEDDDTITGSCAGQDLGPLIGHHGQMLEAVQVIANAIVHRAGTEPRKHVVIDAAGYRERRREILEALALRAAEQVAASGDPVELEPMSAAERKVVHTRLQDVAGVATTSEGAEPARYVVVLPA